MLDEISFNGKKKMNKANHGNNKNHNCTEQKVYNKHVSFF